MKDRQIPRKPESASIPIISPLLHVFTMPVIVFLRYGFGFRFLSPKTVFFAICWAMLLFSIYSYYEPAWWNRAPIRHYLSAAACLLYLAHLLVATRKQWSNAPHDQFAGKSWLTKVCKEDAKLFLWIEPGLIMLLAIFSTVFSETLLSKYLFLTGIALFVKEWINSWARKRKVKTQIDATLDTEDNMGQVLEKREQQTVDNTLPTTSTSRKPRERRRRGY